MQVDGNTHDELVARAVLQEPLVINKDKTMSEQDETELLSIDVAELSAVTGGAHRAGHNDQLTAALTSITESLKSLKTDNSNNPSTSLSQLLPLMMFAKGGARGGGCPGGNCGR